MLEGGGPTGQGLFQGLRRGAAGGRDGITDLGHERQRALELNNRILGAIATLAAVGPIYLSNHVVSAEG